jgi:hypothetical protein
LGGCTISDETKTAQVTASDIGDALGDLLMTVWFLLQGDAEARCSWWEEPGEYRWIFRKENSRVLLRILEFSDLYSDEPDSAGAVVFETTQKITSLASAIAAGADATLLALGEEGYAAKWGTGAFPTETLTLIRSQLDEGPLSA